MLDNQILFYKSSQINMRRLKKNSIFWQFFGYSKIEMPQYRREIEIKRSWCWKHVWDGLSLSYKLKKTFWKQFKFDENDPLLRHCAPLDRDPIGKKGQYFGINPKSIGINLVPSQSHAIPNPDQPPLRIFLKYQQFCTKKKLEFWDCKN